MVRQQPQTGVKGQRGPWCRKYTSKAHALKLEGGKCDQLDSKTADVTKKSLFQKHKIFFFDSVLSIFLLFYLSFTGFWGYGYYSLFCFNFFHFIFLFPFPLPVLFPIIFLLFLCIIFYLFLFCTSYFLFISLILLIVNHVSFLPYLFFSEIVL